MNIEVNARIRPPQRGEGAHTLNVQGTRISQSETHTSHTYNLVFDDDSSNDAIYQSCVSSMVDLLVSGFNCSLLSLGESAAGKTHTLLGDGTSKLGVVHLAFRGVFDRLLDTRDRADGSMTSEVTVSMYEIYNEVVRDLLQPEGGSRAGPGEIAVNAKQWVHVKSLTQVVVRNESDALTELTRGWGKRTQFSTDFGQSQARASLFIQLNLKQEKEEYGYPHISRFLFVELPSIEKLTQNQQDLRKKEGSVQNKAIVSFGQLVRDLSTRQQPDRVVSYSESKASSLLEAAVGGNCKTKAIMHFSPTPDPATLKTSLTLSNQLSRINNFFIINDKAARSLVIQYQARLLSLQGQLGTTTVAAPSTSGDDASQQQAKLARENLKLKEESEYLRRRLDQIQSRFGDIASAKTDLSSRLIGSEEEKLKMSKMLVDLRIENNKLKERAAQDNFELKNKVLSLENGLIQAESERDRLLRDYRQVRDHFDQLDNERQDVGDRYVDLNAEYKALAAKYEAEVGRNQQLGLELLNLLNAEVTLLKQRDTLGRAGLAGGPATDELARVRDIALGLSAERQKVSALDSDKHDLRQKLFGNQDQIRGEIQKMKSVYDMEQDKLQSRISVLNQDLEGMRKADRETQRKLTEAEVELVMLKARSKDLQSANSKLQLQVKEKNEEFRTRLVKYLQDASAHIQKSSSQDGGAGMKAQVEAMIRDLQQTYRTRETQLSQAAREYKHSAEKIAKKHHQLLVEYRLLRQRVGDLKEPGVELGPEEDELSLSMEEVETADRRQLNQISKQLRDTRAELNKIKTESSSEDHWKALKDEFLRTQKDLESERANLLANNSVLEEQLSECQSYIETQMTRYEDEVRRLRRQLGMEDQPGAQGHHRWRDPGHYPSQVPYSIRKYRTLPEI